ncbi:neuroligin-4, Y-linked-like [Actinia tenebrosa]|uniref:Neuroligin-4, Y-linked-like n=1 Tax=Actinia tenebrosa TaxID=6105 RepID=A0A6P8IA44_ACTTE|nr:neuroligin-4, Y-linked-like [Actinia tenebrosa]
MDFVMKSYSLVFICICITLEKHCQGESESSAVIVSTKYGLLKGQTRYFPQPVGNISVVNKFLGVPYAAPPIGELRFLPPQKPKHWKGVYDATRFKPVCYQDPSYNQMFWKKDVNWSQSDDCLYLNVYAPNTTLSHERYPVMVYIHGGGYETGSPVVSPGDALPMWEVVLVTIQYRLGPFGFISTGDSAAPGNYGMLDQIEALKWIQLTIEAFKGDPSRVTIFGESAGGSSVGLLLLSPLSAGLFHRAIALSGSDFAPFAVNTRKEATDLGRATAKKFDCPKETSKDMITCMRNVPAWIIYNKTKGDVNSWRPVVDGIFLQDSPTNLRKANKFHPYPLMVGVTSDDGSFFFNENEVYKTDSLENFNKSCLGLFKSIRRFGWEDRIILDDHIEDAVLFQYTPWSDTKSKHTLRQGLIDLVTDFAFAAPAHAILELHAKVAPAYHFVFSHQSKLRNNLPSWKGATHKDDTPYEFGFPFMNLTVLQHYDEHDKNVSAIMISLFTNFARTGNPTPQPVAGCTWTPFNENNNPYLNITAKPEMRNNFHIRNIAFWNKYYPKLLTTCKYPEISVSKSGGLSKFFMDPYTIVVIAIVLVCSLMVHF